MLSEVLISKFIVCTQTFVEISKVQEELDKFQKLLGKAGEPLEKLILCSRESPAFSTFISFQQDEEKINKKRLIIRTSTQIRLSSLAVEIQAHLEPFPKVTLGQCIQLIEETKRILKEKIGNWKKESDIEFAVLIEIPPELFKVLDPKILEAELPNLVGYETGKKFTNSLSLSKLGQVDEKTDFMVMSFKEVGLLKEAWIIGPPPEGEFIENRARWWYITLLTRHTLRELKGKYDELLRQIVKLEKEVESSTENFPSFKDTEVTAHFFENMADFRKRFIQIRYKLATFHELFECAETNMELVNWGIRLVPSSEETEKVDEKLIACNDKAVFLPDFLIMEASGATWSNVPKNIEELVKSSAMNFLNSAPTLDKGLVEQMKSLLELIKSEVEEDETRAEGLVNRLNSHIDDIMKVVEAQTALMLQKTQTILAQSTAKVEKNFGILTLIFAVFSLGQVVSDFAIWYWGTSESANAVNLINLGWAVGVTILIMFVALLIALVVYLRSFKTSK